MMSHLTSPMSSRFFKIFTAVALSTASLLSGYTPDRLLSPIASSPLPIASAQESSFTRYVRAVYAIEQERKPLMSKVKSITGGNMPDNVCSSGFAQLPGNLKSNIRNICNSFNDEVNAILDRNGFANNTDEFNRYQQQAMNSDRKISREMQKRIVGEMTRLGLK